VAGLKDLRRGVTVNRNRDALWQRQLDKPSAERRIGVWMRLATQTLGRAGSQLVLTLTDEDGCTGTARHAHPPQPADDAAQAARSAREQLGRLGATIFEAIAVDVDGIAGHFVPASVLNALRRDAVEALEAHRLHSLQRLARAEPVEPPAPYPEQHLSYLANVLNSAARRFYERHGVQLIAPAYEAIEEPGEVSLMITKHCVRFSLSLCPKQAKGVTGVQGTVRAEPLQLVNGREKLTLRFDCKPCEMHVVGRMKPGVAAQAQRERAEAEAQGVPVVVYRSRPGANPSEPCPSA
jgi:putative protease